MKKYEGADRDAYIDRISEMVKNACAEHKVTHPEDIYVQFATISEIVAAWEAEK